MNPACLAQMANDIGTFFRADPDHDTAVEGIAGHIKRFWEPRMRKQLIAHLNNGGEDLDELVKEAIRRIAATQPSM